VLLLALTSWWDQTRQTVGFLFSPNNPFVPWMHIYDLGAILVHLAIVYWVYRDALYRYNRGAPWAVLAAVIPLGGWLFYLLYRQSQLVEFDRHDAECFDEAEHEWTDYDQYRKDQAASLFRDVRALWRRQEGSGYSPWVRMSRLRELRRTLTPEEYQARREERIRRRAEQAASRRQRRLDLHERKQLRVMQKRERQTMIAAHGFKYRMTDRRRRGVQRKLELMQRLRTLPREDPLLEELIYEMDYEGALRAAHDSLAVAVEMRDAHGEVTYRSYIERLEKLLARDDDARADGASDSS